MVCQIRLSSPRPAKTVVHTAAGADPVYLLTTAGLQFPVTKLYKSHFKAIQNML